MLVPDIRTMLSKMAFEQARSVRSGSRKGRKSVREKRRDEDDPSDLEAVISTDVESTGVERADADRSIGSEAGAQCEDRHRPRERVDAGRGGADRELVRLVVEAGAGCRCTWSPEVVARRQVRRALVLVKPGGLERSLVGEACSRGRAREAAAGRRGLRMVERSVAEDVAPSARTSRLGDCSTSSPRDQSSPSRSRGPVP